MAMTDGQLRHLRDRAEPCGKDDSFRPIVVELLAARATLAGIRKCAELYARDNLSANIRMIGADLLAVLDQPKESE